MLKIRKYIRSGINLSWWLCNFWRFGKIGKKSIFYSSLKITPASILCGEGVMVWKNSRIEGVTKYNNVAFHPKIELRDNVTIQQNVHITCANSIIVGANTAIAANVTITDIHHPYKDISIPIEKQDIEVNPVFIGDDCKIYNNVVILPGTRLGRHCTIGANSVVSGNYPDYCVVAGSPAKIIKKYNVNTQMWE